MDRVDINTLRPTTIRRDKDTAPANKAVIKTDPKLSSDIQAVRASVLQFKSDVDRFDSVTKNKNDDNKQNKINAQTEVATASLSIIPFFRRFSSVDDAIKAHDTVKAVAKGFIALNNVPEDSRDVMNATKQIKSKLKGEFINTIPNEYQSRFSFFRGTFLEPVLKKLVDSDNEKLNRIAFKIYDADKPLLDTKFGEKIQDLLGIKYVKNDFHYLDRVNVYGRKVKAYKIVGGNAFTRLLGRAMFRVPVIALGIAALLEIPNIVVGFSTGKDNKERAGNGGKQLVKSANTLTFITAGSAILGAIGAAKKGSVGSMVGIGLGSYLGTKAAKIVNEKIDNIGNNDQKSQA